MKGHGKELKEPGITGNGIPRRNQARAAAVVVVAAFMLWMGFSWLGGELGLPVRYAFLVDFAALAAFFWSFVVLVRVWRKSRLGGI